MKQIRNRLTYANVMSSIAVFLVLGGATALAASGLGKNSVGSKQLKKNAVTSAKIKNNAVTTAKIQNGAVSGAKINLGSLGTVPSAANAANAGNANTVGGMTVSKINYVANSNGPSQVVLNTQGLVLTASCPGGQTQVVATAPGVPAGVGVEFNWDTNDGGGTDDGKTPGTIFNTGDLFIKARNRGTFTFQRSDGPVVTGTFASDITPAIYDSFGGSHGNCAVAGTIIAG